MYTVYIVCILLSSFCVLPFLLAKVRKPSPLVLKNLLSPETQEAYQSDFATARSFLNSNRSFFLSTRCARSLSLCLAWALRSGIKVMRRPAGSSRSNTGPKFFNLVCIFLSNLAFVFPSSLAHSFGSSISNSDAWSYNPRSLLALLTRRPNPKPRRQRCRQPSRSRSASAAPRCCPTLA